MKSRASEVQENSLTVLNSLRRRKAQRAVIIALTLREKNIIFTRFCFKVAEKLKPKYFCIKSFLFVNLT